MRKKMVESQMTGRKVHLSLCIWDLSSREVCVTSFDDTPLRASLRKFLNEWTPIEILYAVEGRKTLSKEVLLFFDKCHYKT